MKTENVITDMKCLESPGDVFPDQTALTFSFRMNLTDACSCGSISVSTGAQTQTY